jgi:hypothetical protein
MDSSQMRDSIMDSAKMSMFISIGVTVVVITLVFFFVRRYMKRITGADLKATGEPAVATVVQMWDTGTTVNQHPVVGFLLNVQPSTSAPYQVQTQSMIPRLSIGQVQPGAQVRVKIDPANRQRVVIDLFGA